MSICEEVRQMSTAIRSLFTDKTKKKATHTKEKIKRVYINNKLPWIVGYSGGKDSTLVVQLIIETLLKMKNEGIQLNKKIYIISSDTLVENPLVSGLINTALTKIERISKEHDLQIKTQLLTPPVNESFWVNLIGRGYPAPNQNFRWCTDRLKILPANNFITSMVSNHGKVITVLGVREGESNTRDRVLKNHHIEGNDLMRHSTLTNAYVFAPIIEFNIDDVWNYLLDNESPWGDDNRKLYNLYSESFAGECPLIIDKDTKEKAGSCGNSRFGCWTCTVVRKDKSLTGFIESGYEWLRPLLSFRNWLFNTRDLVGFRMHRRINGQVYFLKLQEKIENDRKYISIREKGGRKEQKIYLDDKNNDFTIIDESELSNYIRENSIDLTKGEELNLIIKRENNYYILGPGGYTIEARKEILRQLLSLEKEINIPEKISFKHLISIEELREIRRLWIKSGDIDDSLPKIYEEINPNEFVKWDQDDDFLLSIEQYDDLKKLASFLDVSFDAVKELLLLEKKYLGLKSRAGILVELKNILNKDYLHIDKEYHNEN